MTLASNMSPALQEAIQFIEKCETPWSRDTSPPWGIHEVDPPPYNRLYGPVHGRGPVSGVIFHKHVMLAEWGQPRKADLTFSVAKTYLALLAGVAFDQGLLPDVHEPVIQKCPGIGFEGERLKKITWHHLLQQTSEWEGTCLGIPEQVDRYRWLTYQPGKADGIKGDARPLGEPGSRFEYNDVRINQLSLALLHLFQRPLPEVFEEFFRKPLGCSDEFQWVGYEQGWTDVNGRSMMSVPGGSHWGGGVSISTRDQALIGVMLMGNGNFKGTQILSAKWLDMMQQPCDVASYYGYLIWLNKDGAVFKDAPRSSWFALGAGSSVTWVDPKLELVCIMRWIDAPKTNDCIAHIMRAL
jgi:CubicO group peptidase (beta-lactamase class C family)